MGIMIDNGKHQQPDHYPSCSQSTETNTSKNNQELIV